MYLFVSQIGEIYVAYHSELSIYNVDYKPIKRIKTIGYWDETTVSGMCQTRKGDIYMAIWGGTIYKMNNTTRNFSPVKFNPPRGLIKQIVQNIDNDYITAATWESGIITFNPDADCVDSMYIYTDVVNPRTGKLSNRIIGMDIDKVFGYVWITGDDCCTVLKQLPDGKFTTVDLNIELPQGEMLVDVFASEDCVYISSFNSNSFVVNLDGNGFEINNLTDIRSVSGYNPAIMALCCDDNYIWLMQERFGLMLYNTLNGQITPYNSFPELKNVYLSAGRQMRKSPNGIFLVPDNCRLVHELTRQNDKIKLLRTLNFDPYSPQISDITGVFLNNNTDKLFVGFTTQLCIADYKGKEPVKTINNTGHVTGFTQDYDNNTWVCTMNDLIKIKPDFSVENQNLNKEFSCICIDNKGLIWTGTYAGEVFSYNPQTRQFRRTVHRCNLNGDMINQIYIDEYNHLWIVTNTRVIEYNIDNNSFRIWHTGENNKMPVRFLPTAFTVDNQGKIYVGGIPGICKFSPSNTLEKVARNIKTTITDIKIQNVSAIFSLKRFNADDDTIIINSDDKNIEIFFSRLNIINADKARYCYKLEGFDKDSTIINNGGNSAFYNYLPKGTYTFKVWATDNNGLWSENICNLTIIRTPAWYETAAAIIIYIVLCIGLILYLIMLYIKKINRKHEELWNDGSEMLKMKHWLTDIYPAAAPEYEQLEKEIIKKATEYVEANLRNSDFDVEKLSQAMNMSRSTLTRKLKTITGLTPLDFINKIKMRHALILLRDKNRTVTEVAADLGCYNRKYFTARFKAEFGFTPSEARNKEE